MPHIDPERLTPTFCEAFRGPGLDVRTWLTRYWWGGRSLPANGELQFFADGYSALVHQYPAANPFTLRGNGGGLEISSIPSPDPGLTHGLPGMINTHGSFAQLHGYFELRARLPRGAGLWPAFWLLPAAGSWPPELDVMECLCRDTLTYHAGVHWAADGHRFLTRPVPAGVDLSDGFNSFGCLWTATELAFYLNRRRVLTVSTPPRLTLPMYMLAGLAVGGTWGGPPEASTDLPARMSMAHVRAWAL